MSSVAILPTPLNQFGSMAETHMERFRPKETAELKKNHQWMPTLLQYQRRMEALMEAMTTAHLDPTEVPEQDSFQFLLARHQMNRLQAEEQFFTQILPPPEF